MGELANVFAIFNELFRRVEIILQFRSDAPVAALLVRTIVDFEWRGMSTGFLETRVYTNPLNWDNLLGNGPEKRGISHRDSNSIKHEFFGLSNTLPGTAVIAEKE